MSDDRNTGGDAYSKERLHAALLTLGMERDVSRETQILSYLGHLQHWNKAYNLTAIRDPKQMLVQHVFDSLAVVPELRRWASTRNQRVLHVADIGSGAGLPGIIIGICEPDWQVTCVDAVGKKTAFIRQAAGLLGLSNVHAYHGRVEKAVSLQADVVISRAFSALADFVLLASHHCKPDGVMMAMKGQDPQDERTALQSQTDWHVVHQVTLQVPDMAAQRCMLTLAPRRPINEDHE